VLLSVTERTSRIEADIAGALTHRETKGAEWLKREWAHLVEWPTVMVGAVPSGFQQLPLEVVATVLSHHQKYIPLGVRGDKRISGFLAVTNTDSQDRDAIVRNMERVVVARLRDADFFFKQDVKRSLSDRVQDLSGIMFHEGFGDYLQKTERLVRIVEVMGTSLKLLTDTDRDLARMAAHVAKADLTTLMVREFPELQGVMGSIYLENEGGIPLEVVEAVRWHYHPMSVEENSLPAREVSSAAAAPFAAVALADKLDLVVAFFARGERPTGSRDPFGVRRAGNGIVRILVDFWVTSAETRRPSIRGLLTIEPLQQYFVVSDSSREETLAALEAFFLERLRHLFASRGFPSDEIDAIFGAFDPGVLDDPREAWLRLQALHRVRSEARDDFEHLAVAFKRARNIVGEAASKPVDPGLFEHEAEHELARALREAGHLLGAEPELGGGPDVLVSRGRHKYEIELKSLAKLRQPVDRFFDDVLVMAEDPALRANRLGLLGQALSLFYRIADISKLGGVA
jgi:glycyl-tRNA synthetase beta chain